ncbi:MAG: M48 family metallopeptidase [Pirellulaceae bacterium]
MDFFHSQDVARRKTTLLIAYFVAGVVSIVLALYAVAVVAVTASGKGGMEGDIDLWRWDIFIAVSFLTLTTISLGSLYKIWELHGGGENVATSLGGRRIHPNTSDPGERRLLNVVEEMALASGIPVPAVFVLDGEDTINAFAAGFTPGDAVIGVNRGTIQILSRDELQGVIAHEFSHILNGDMRLNLRLVGLLHGILLLAIIGYYAMRFGGVGRRGSGGKGSGAAVLLIGLALIIIGYVGLFYARLIKSAVSRQREYLADASAVQFTRNPDGIAGALKKIGGLLNGSALRTPEAETASHMFFGNALKGFSFSGLATHPPLETRIRKIDPQFDGRFPPIRPRQRQAERPQPEKAETPRRSPFDSLRPALGTFGDRLPLDPVLIMAAVGAPTMSHVAYAQRLLQALPEELKHAVHDTFSARAVVFALLLDEDAEIRQQQLQYVQEHLGPAAHDETVTLAPLVAASGDAARLPLIEIVQSTLLQLSPEQYKQFRETVTALVKADRKIDLFEFALQRVLLNRLERHFFGGKTPGVRYPAVNGVVAEIRTVLSALAYLGHRKEDEAHTAFVQAMATLKLDRPLDLCSKSECTLPSINAALDKLALASPVIKKRLLHAAMVVVAVDGKVTVGEAELLRAIGDSLECPLPPIFAGSIDVPAT